MEIQPTLSMLTTIAPSRKTCTSRIALLSEEQVLSRLMCLL
jgi:hypothetical protein